MNTFLLKWTQAHPASNLFPLLSQGQAGIQTLPKLIACPRAAEPPTHSPGESANAKLRYFDPGVVSLEIEMPRSRVPGPAGLPTLPRGQTRGTRERA
ncbi:hypothetical protein SBA3_2810010 [Candidatus Sulfopaludibacter sp. SbA3]|nr:hypothetical protein SBA3_2810010 [Candidatus Sulfopaludibacter sp. SbA3]